MRQAASNASSVPAPVITEPFDTTWDTETEQNRGQRSETVRCTNIAQQRNARQFEGVTPPTKPPDPPQHTITRYTTQQHRQNEHCAAQGPARPAYPPPCVRRRSLLPFDDHIASAAWALHTAATARPRPSCAARLLPSGPTCPIRAGRCPIRAVGPPNRRRTAGDAQWPQRRPPRPRERSAAACAGMEAARGIQRPPAARFRVLRLRGAARGAVGRRGDAPWCRAGRRPSEWRCRRPAATRSGAQSPRKPCVSPSPPHNGFHRQSH